MHVYMRYVHIWTRPADMELVHDDNTDAPQCGAFDSMSTQLYKPPNRPPSCMQHHKTMCSTLKLHIQAACALL